MASHKNDTSGSLDAVSTPASVYPLHGVRHPPEFKGLWDDAAWGEVPVLAIDQFRAESSDHRPVTEAKLQYDAQGLYGIFRVRDRYVCCRHRRYQDPVYKDSCVEFFFQPSGSAGYFNFEFNCGGAMLVSYIIDPTRTDEGFRDFVRPSKSDVRRVKIYHSEDRIVDPEREGDTTWYLEYYIPRGLIEKYAGPVRLKAGTVWRANLYKCGDATSHPHWGAWSPVNALNFHLPHCFGELHFMP